MPYNVDISWQMYIRRSAGEEKRAETSEIVSFLSKLAFSGLIGQGPGEITRLTFDEDDLTKIRGQPEQSK